MNKKPPKHRKSPKYRLKSQAGPFLRGRTLVFLLLIAAALWSLHRFRGTEEETQQVSQPQAETGDRTIEHPRIAVVAPLSGPFKNQGEMLRQGASLAWEDSRLPEEARVELSFLDGGKDPAETVRMARRLASDPRLLAVVAHLPASELLAFMPAYKQKKIPLIVPANSHQSLAGHAGVIPLLPSDRSEGAYAAKAAAKSAEGKGVAVLASPSAYGKLLTEGFEQAAREAGLNFSTSTCDPDQSSWQEQVRQVAESHPAVIWLAGSPLWGGRVVQELVANNYGGELLAPHSYDNGMLEDQMGECCSRLCILRPVSPTPRGGEFEDFHKRFLHQYWREPDWLAMLGYDALRLVADAIREGPVTRIAVQEHFLQYSSRDNAFHGVCGTVFFKGTGVAERPLHAAVFQDGKFVATHD